MLSVDVAFWASGGLICLEAMYTAARSGRRYDMVSAAAFFFCTALLFFGFAFLLGDNARLVDVGLIVVGLAAPLIPAAWLSFTAVWGRDVGGGTLARRNAAWYIIAIGVALLLAAGNVVEPIVSDASGVDWDDYFEVGGYSFWVFIYYLTAYLFGMYNIENCYRSALGSQRRLLRTGLLVGLLLSALAFAVATFGILSRRLIISSLAGIAGILPILFFILLRHLQRLGVGSGGVVVTRRIASSSRVILTGAVYFLIVGGLSMALSSFEYGPDFLMALVAGLLAVTLLLAVIIMGDFMRRQAGGRYVGSEFSPLSNVTEFIEEISLFRTVDELLDRIRLFLSSNFGVSQGALVERLEAGRYSARPFGGSGYRLTSPSIEALSDWLHRYGRPILVADLIERTADSGLDVSWMAAELNLTPALVVPIISRQNIIGMLVLGDGDSDTENIESITQFVETIAPPLAMAVQNSRITEQLIRSREMESFHKISSYVLHDLKNSVGMLDLLLANAAKNMGNPEFQQSMVRTIGDAVTRQRRIISRLSEPTSGAKDIATTLNVNDLLKKVIDKVQVKKIERVELKVSYGDVPILTASPQALQSVFENLIVNAIEAMPVKGTLTIKTSAESRDDGQTIVVTVTDTGQGMSREFIEHKLFQPFTSTKKKGLGIGMYQTSETIRQMAGDITVSSEEGKGTTFTVSLPV